MARKRPEALVRNLRFIQANAMKTRDSSLQDFYDLTESAILASAGTCPKAQPAAMPVFAALRERQGTFPSVVHQVLPVCASLEPALKMAAPIPELAEALRALKPRLRWERRTSAPPDGTSFYDGHANALVVGPGGLEEREDVWLGLSLLAPHVRYPDHRHPPEEVYVSLAGGAWWNSNMDWTTPGPGGLIHNEPNVLHAMRTEAEPLLAIWCLWVGR
jgi:quercetin dioxygenase-like cupin family protein